MRWLFVLFVGLGIVGAVIINYFALGKRTLVPGQIKVINKAIDKVTNRKSGVVEYRIEEFARDLLVPWSIVFIDDSRILIAQRNGQIREIENGNLKNEPWFVISAVSQEGEAGLMGMDKDPSFATNGYLYVCFAYQKNGKLADKVVRLKDDNGEKVQQTLIDDIPAAQYHAGCRVKFGPDGKLYITTGDATNDDLAQDTNSLAGKILRINSDGSIPEDNPFGNAVWSFGHRNPQGIAWHPVTGDMFATEHGPSVFDGPAGGDEVNIIIKGLNYGWPIVSHERSKEGMVSPEIVFTPAFAPASGMFYKGEVFPQFENSFFFGGLAGEGIMRVMTNESGEIAAYENIEGIDYGRIRDVVEGPDGFIYFSTSNRDGRGTAEDGDDKIYRIVPKD